MPAACHAMPAERLVMGLDQGDEAVCRRYADNMRHVVKYSTRLADEVGAEQPGRSGIVTRLDSVGGDYPAIAEWMRTSGW